MYVEAVLHTYKDLEALDRFTGSRDTPVRHLRARSREFAYIMGDASGKVFGSELQREGII